MYSMFEQLVFANEVNCVDDDGDDNVRVFLLYGSKRIVIIQSFRLRHWRLLLLLLRHTATAVIFVYRTHGNLATV